GVAVEGDRGFGVSGLALDGDDVEAAGDQLGDIAVAKVVHGELLLAGRVEPGAVGGLVEAAAAQVAVVVGAVALGLEDEVFGLGAAAAEGGRAVGTQDLLEPGEQVDVAHAGVALQGDQPGGLLLGGAGEL